MPRISACIISYNEEEKIEECLQSLGGVVDEIVLVDSFSTDRTIEIAQRFTDRIIRQEFLGYIEQKNFASSRAENDWILNLDCDERLTPELARSIRELRDGDDHHTAYRMARKTFYVYRWLNHCWYPEYRTRLYNRRFCSHQGTNPHDRVHVDEGTVGRLQGDLLHYSFDSVGDHIKTLDRFTEIAARKLVERKKRVTVFTPFTHGTWTFFKLYILRFGFLDGFAGLVVSILSFMHVFSKYTKALTYKYQRRRGLRLTALDGDT
jgi:glycosyltransferase involved in cell wall biosynthesis